MKKNYNNQDNPSQFLVDLNNQQLDRFFHPEKYPKVAITISAIAIIIFLIVATTFPVQDHILNLLYQKESSQAQTDKSNLPELYFESELNIVINKEFNVRIMTNPDSSTFTYLLKIKYPKEYFEAIKIDSQNSFIKNWTNLNIDSEGGLIQVEGFGIKEEMKSKGYNLSIIGIIFKPKKSGEAKIEFSPDTRILDLTGKNIINSKENITIKVGE